VIIAGASNVSIVKLLMGILLLFYGRTLYWAFVAVAGFLVGFELATELLAEQPESVRVVVALLGGVLGAVLGMLAQRVAFSIAGLFAGGYLALALAHAVDIPGEPLAWFFVGAIIGAIIGALITDWAIIALSSLAGAAAIVGELELNDSMAILLFVALSAIGMIIQGRRLLYLAPRQQSAIE
jgi:hypothetical protein